MQLTTTINLSVQANGTKALDLSTATDPIAQSLSISMANGTGADQANQSWSDRRTVTFGANDDLDLAGALTDAFGDTIVFTKIKAIYIRNLGSAGGPGLRVGGSPSNPFVAWLIASGDGITIPAGGVFLLTAPDATGFAVAAGSADVLRLTHNSGSSTAIQYDIILVGTV